MSLPGVERAKEVEGEGSDFIEGHSSICLHLGVHTVHDPRRPWDN